MQYNAFFNVIGFTGACMILFGFYRVSIGQWTNKSVFYELDNLLGAVFLVTYQLHYRTYVTVVLNVVWIIVAFHGLTSYAVRRKPRAGKRKRT